MTSLAKRSHPMTMDASDPRLDDLARRIGGLSDADLKQQRDILRLIDTPLLRSLASDVGVDVDGLLGQHREAREGTAALLQAAIWFGPLGWTVTARHLKMTDYLEAVRLWQTSHDAAAIDAYLTRAWADGDGVWLRGAFGPLTTLAGRHEATRDMLLARNRLVHKALDHHMRGEYEASTMIVLAQVDGLTLDFTEGKFAFFYNAKDKYFEDDETVAGMPEFLRVVRHAVNPDDNVTSSSTAFLRHPIVHGRYVAFGTETNSTKAFALLAGVIEWLKPRAAALTEKWQAAHEARYAGSDERDAEGAHLDQRGFSEARDSLRWLAIREANEYRNAGRYNDDLRAMFPAAAGIGGMQRPDRTTLAVADDGRSYWAWCESDTPVCFGIAARDGEVMSYYYADVGLPGAMGEDRRWTYELDDRPPDWRGE